MEEEEIEEQDVLTRRAYKLLAVLIKSNSEAGRASWQFSEN